jgi:serine/threonine protein kinase
MKEEIDRQVTKSFDAKEEWKSAITKIKTIKGVMEHVKGNTSNENSPTVTSTTVMIDGKEYQRPVLRIFNVVKDNAIFEVPEHYEVKKVLGFGAYGVVVSAFDHKSKKEVAIKKMFNTFSQSVDYQKRILREIQLMIHFRDHPNVKKLKN